MVATRGNAVHENERKSSLPSRESRRSTRGAMQEPEDEVRRGLCLGRRVTRDSPCGGCHRPAPPPPDGPGRGGLGEGEGEGGRGGDVACRVAASGAVAWGTHPQAGLSLGHPGLAGPRRPGHRRGGAAPPAPWRARGVAARRDVARCGRIGISFVASWCFLFLWWSLCSLKSGEH